MDDLVQLLIFLAIVFFSILSGAGKRKKTQGRTPDARPRPRVAPGGRAEAARSAPVRTSGTGARSGSPAVEQPTEMMEGLLDLLRGRVPIEVPAPQPAPPAEIDEEAVSLESLEPDMAASHRSFRERYVEPVEPAPGRRPQHRYRLTPKTAREAVVWTAIFGKPKGSL